MSHGQSIQRWIFGVREIATRPILTVRSIALSLSRVE